MEGTMNKKIISIVAIVALVAVLGVCFVACGASSYESRLEKVRKNQPS